MGILVGKWFPAVVYGPKNGMVHSPLRILGHGVRGLTDAAGGRTLDSPESGAFRSLAVLRVGVLCPQQLIEAEVRHFV